MNPQAWLNFHAELNDFLKPQQKNQTLIYPLNRQASIKDIIEAIGVPHPEVNLILVNGHPVDFSYLLRNGDHVSTYPSPRTLTTDHPPKFILDVHLGALARYMRLLGLDVLYSNQYNDEQIIHLAQQLECIILTRDVALLKRKTVSQGYWLRNTAPKLQVQEVLKRFDLLGQIKPLTRCLSCNGIIQSVPKTQIIEQLPPKTKIFYQQFYQCQNCHKIYWQGAHFQKILNLIKELT